MVLHFEGVKNAARGLPGLQLYLYLRLLACVYAYMCVHVHRWATDPRKRPSSLGVSESLIQLTACIFANLRLHSLAHNRAFLCAVIVPLFIFFPRFFLNLSWSISS